MPCNMLGDLRKSILLASINLPISNQPKELFPFLVDNVGEPWSLKLSQDHSGFRLGKEGGGSEREGDGIKFVDKITCEYVNM